MNPAYAHRHLHAATHAHKLQTGPDVVAVQRAIKQLAQHYGLGSLKVDGQCGRQTIAKGRQVAEALGLKLRKHGLTIYVQHLLRHPHQRNPFQTRRSHRWRAAHPRDTSAKVQGNTVVGGKDARDKIVAAAMEAAHQYYTGKSHRFYSQPGKWTVEYGVTGEPVGFRSDCSQFVTSMYHSAGAPDPNGTGYTGGFTGTLGGPGGKYVSEADARPGDYVLYGPQPHHHVELLVGPGNRTVGHGSPPVDYGDAHMIADPNFYRPDGI